MISPGPAGRKTSRPTRTAWLLPPAVLVGRAKDALREARWPVAEARAAAALLQAPARGLSTEHTELLNVLGAASFERGQLREAERWFGQALAASSALGYGPGEASSLVNLGAVANVRGDLVRALDFYRRGRWAFHRIDNLPGEARALNNIGMVFADLERWGSARRSYRAARRIALELDDDALVGLIALNATEVYIESERLVDARESCDEAVERLTAAGDKLGPAEAYRYYGQIFLRSGKPALAEAHFERAARRGRELGAPLTEAEALREIGRLQLSFGRHRSALEALGRSLKLFRGLEAARDLEDLRGKIDDLESLIVNLVERLGREVEERGGAYLYGHSARVAEYAVAIACDLGFGSEEMKGILVAGYLHDIGKLRIDEKILNKEGLLTDEEREQVRLHPVYGVEHLERFELPWDVEAAVRGHHERFDGTGYPDGIAGEEIPLAARILLVADVFDALTTARPYREPWSRDQALTYLQMSSGTLSDPTITELFVEIARREAYGPDEVALRTEERRGMRPEELARAFAALPHPEDWDHMEGLPVQYALGPEESTPGRSEAR
ncbi:MAG TPA: HD domain-containing phosphohydrolase [Gemmatimonadota bacterium]|nr:HD domain-containing phosphohydrolase [Gemmatimonadota bacterium]